MAACAPVGEDRAGGQTHMDWFSQEADAEAALVTLETAKRRRGYYVEPQQLALFGEPQEVCLS